MANKHWEPEGTQEFFCSLEEIKGYHPAVYPLFAAVVNMCNIQPTSLTRKIDMVNAFRFIINSINKISETDDSYDKIKIEDPWEAIFDSLPTNEVEKTEEGKILPFKKSSNMQSL